RPVPLPGLRRARRAAHRRGRPRGAARRDADAAGDVPRVRRGDGVGRLPRALPLPVLRRLAARGSRASTRRREVFNRPAPWSVAPVHPDVLAPSDTFARRHIAPTEADLAEMLAALGYKSLDELVWATVPSAIRIAEPLRLGDRLPLGEHELIDELRNIAADNQVLRSFIGQ